MTINKTNQNERTNMKTLIKVNDRYIGYIKPHGNRWKAKPINLQGKLFDQAMEAANYVRYCGKLREI